MNSFYINKANNEIVQLGHPGSVVCLLENDPKTIPIRHSEHGLGWSSESIGATYFLSVPSLLQQEILAV